MRDHDIDFHSKDVVLETSIPFTAKQDGDYYFSNRYNTTKTFIAHEAEAAKIVGETYFSGKGRELKLTKITGINENTELDNLSEIDGIVMTHKVFVGSYQVESGWQWFGRPESLFQARQPGFIQ